MKRPAGLALLFPLGLALGCGGQDPTGSAWPLDEEVASVESAATLGWSDDAQIPNQQSARQPGLAYFGGRLHMVHAGSGSPNELWWSTYNGASWSTNLKIPSQTSDGAPALAAYSGRLYMAYKVAGQSKIVVTSTTGTSWSAPAPGVAAMALTNQGYRWTVTPRYAPALAVHGGSLYMAYCAHITGDLGTYDELRLDRYTGASSTTNIALFTVQQTCTGAALASFGGKLHVIYNDYTPAGIFGPLTPAETWLRESLIDPAIPGSATTALWMQMNSARPASVAVCGTKAHLVHSGDGSPSAIWVSAQATTGTAWAANVKLTNQTSDGGAAVGCFGSTPILVHNGGTNQLWWAHNP